MIPIATKKTVTSKKKVNSNYAKTRSTTGKSTSSSKKSGGGGSPQYVQCHVCGGSGMQKNPAKKKTTKK